MQSSFSITFERPVLQRASKACHNCRIKKVKCDLAAQRASCTNCDRNGTECHTLKSKRGKKRPASQEAHGAIQGARKYPSLISGESRRSDSPIVVDQDPANNDFQPFETSPEPTNVRLSQHPHVNDNYQAHEIDCSVLHRQLSYTSLIRKSHVEPQALPKDDDLFISTPSESVSGTGRAITGSPRKAVYGLPEYIQDVNEHVGVHDTEILWKCGAFDVPSPPLRSALIEAFIEFVYPTMPVVDLKNLILATSLSMESEGPKISILLFQAIMFSAVAFVDDTLLMKDGFLSRLTARRIFLRRAKVRSFRATASALWLIC